MKDPDCTAKLEEIAANVGLAAGQTADALRELQGARRADGRWAAGPSSRRDGRHYGEVAASAGGGSGHYTVTFAGSAAACAALATANGLDPVFATATIDGRVVTVRTCAGAALLSSSFFHVVTC